MSYNKNIFDINENKKVKKKRKKNYIYCAYKNTHESFIVGLSKTGSREFKARWYELACMK